MSIEIVILAAGQGKRMYSKMPKVLHKLGGKRMLEHVIETAQSLKPAAIHVIYGHGGEILPQTLAHLEVNWILQQEQLGTGHAIMQALPHVKDNSTVLILSGDVPLIEFQTLEALVKKGESSLTLLTAILANPFGLGRILRDEKGSIKAIVEEKDANEEQKAIQEIYSGICTARREDLARWLPKLNNNNAQGEYYLTDIIRLAVEEGKEIGSNLVANLYEIQGVNNRLQLQELERIYQQNEAKKLMLQGVGFADAARFDLRGSLECGEDVFIDINVVIEGQVTIGRGTLIGPNCVLKNVSIGEDCEIFANSVLEEATLANHCQIGPFARLRPGTQLANHCKIGNFVETKNTFLDEHSKASHLTYLGDTTIGKSVNIGAGTITCNYDGVNKHKTIIEDGVFVGSATQLVAPVKVGAHATIGAGSTIRNDVPANELTLTFCKQKTVYGWQRPKKK